MNFINNKNFYLLKDSIAAAAAKSLQSSPTLCDPMTAAHQAPPSLGFSRQQHWSGLPFLLQCMKVKSESEVAQSCPTLSNPMDCSLPGSSFCGIFQARGLEWGAIASSPKRLATEWEWIITIHTPRVPIFRITKNSYKSVRQRQPY